MSGEGTGTRSWRWLREHAVNIVAGLVVLSLLIPIAVIFVFSFNDPAGRYNYTWVGFTFEHWLHAFSREDLTEALLTSLKLALLATVISTVIGTMMALALVRHQFRGRRGANFLIVIPMATPEVVMGAALLSFFLILGTPSLGFQTLLIAHVIFCAAMLAFALSIDDFVISNFNSGTTVTFPLYIFGAAQRGIPVEVNVIAMILFGVTVAAMGFATWQQQRAEKMASVRPDQEAAPMPAPAGAPA